MKKQNLTYATIFVTGLTAFVANESMAKDPQLSMPTPPGYSTNSKCSVYTVMKGKGPIKIAEIFKYNAVTKYSCQQFVLKHYAPIPNCGYTIPIHTINEKEELSVIGILEAADTKATVLSVSDKIRVVSPSTSVVTMAPAACAQATQMRSNAKAEIDSNAKAETDSIAKAGTVSNAKAETVSNAIAETVSNAKVITDSQVCDYEKTKFCVNSASPILTQSSPELAQYISSVTNDPSIKRDPGWCGPTATAMSLLGTILPEELEIYTDKFLWKRNLLSSEKAQDLNINKRTGLYGDLIYNIGNTMETRWAAGGSNTEVGVRHLYTRIDPSIRNLDIRYYDGEVKREYYALAKKELTLDNLIDKFSKGRNVTVLSTQKYRQPCDYTSKEIKRTDKLIYYEVSYTCDSTLPYKQTPGSHAVSVNGIEDGYVKIYDPWGRVYNVELRDGDKAQGIPTGSPLMAHVTGEIGGFMGDDKTPTPRLVAMPHNVSVDNVAKVFANRYVNSGKLRGYTTSTNVRLKSK